MTGMLTALLVKAGAGEALAPLLAQGLDRLVRAIAQGKTRIDVPAERERRRMR